ncbi:hypothetical protein [Streptomyces sp. NPDC020141]
MRDGAGPSGAAPGRDGPEQDDAAPPRAAPARRDADALAALYDRHAGPP